MTGEDPKYLGFPVTHAKIHLDEIQSLDIKEIVEHKIRQAYSYVQNPVLVEDVGLSFSCFGKLPGPFIKFFESEIGLEKLTHLVDATNRSAIAHCIFGYFDGIHIEFFEGNIPGKIAESPRGNGGFGWDSIFIPYWTEKTSAELNKIEYERFYTETKPFTEIREFLQRQI